MPDERADEHARVAVQYLVWALEEIEKSGTPDAARHARAAIKCLQVEKRHPIPAK